MLIAGPLQVEELAAKAAEENKSLIEYLAIIRSVVFNNFLAAAEAGDRNGVWQGGGRLLDVLREVGRLTGELREATGLTINNNSISVVSSPEFLSLQEGLLKLARAHPAARQDIIEMLRSMGRTPSEKLSGSPKPLMIKGDALEDAA